MQDKKILVKKTKCIIVIINVMLAARSHQATEASPASQTQRFWMRFAYQNDEELMMKMYPLHLTMKYREGEM